MSLRKETPCNFGECPYNAEYNYTCEYWCEEDEPSNYDEYDDYDYETGFNPYEGCYDFDC